MTSRPLAILALLCAAANARAADLPPDLALVPEGSYGFAHVRLAEIASKPLFGYYRDSLAGAGPKALAAFDSQFAPAPSTTDRVTLAAVPADGPGSPPMPLVIVRFTKKFDPKRVVATYSSDAKPLTVGNVSIHRIDGETCLATVEDQLILVGPSQAIQEALKKRDKSPELLAKLARAAGGKSVLFATVSRKTIPLPPGAENQIPPQFRPVAKLEELTLAIGLTDKLDASLTAKYPNEADAKAAEETLQLLAKEGRKQLAQSRGAAEKELFAPPPEGKGRPLDQLPAMFGALATLSGFQQGDAFLANLPVKLAGDTLSAEGSVAADSMATPALMAVGIGLLLPAVQKVRAAAARAQSSNNMKQIMLAMFEYENKNGTYPPAAICDKEGKPLLSWRVAILPYIEQNALYKQFKLDEPWDSEHNKKLIPIVVKVYTDPQLPLSPGTTIYKVFTGAGASFGAAKGPRIADITDGTSNTVGIAAGGDPVIWTKPEDFVFDGKTLPRLTTPNDILLCGFLDGSVRALRLAGADKVDDTTLKALLTPRGGEVTRLK